MQNCRLIGYCIATLPLAGMRLHGNFLQFGGRSIFKRCGATSGPGGGLHMSGNFSHMAGELKVHDCEASANAGGGIAVNQHVSLESTLNVSRCRAAKGGRTRFPCQASEIPSWTSGTGCFHRLLPLSVCS